MNLFFIQEMPDGGNARVSGQEHQHLSRVLRLHAGDRVLLNDRSGAVYEAVIERIERDYTDCGIAARHERFNEPPVPIALLQGLLKNPGKMDWIVEKGTELGMSMFIPLVTQRTVSASVKTPRLRNLAEAAVKQCLRAVVPEIPEATDVEESLRMLDGYRLLVFHETADMEARPEALIFDGRPLALFIGPEGGFTDEEVEQLRTLGADILSLGPRRLRGETAAIAALARVVAQVESLIDNR